MKPLKYVIAFNDAAIFKCGIVVGAAMVLCYQAGKRSQKRIDQAIRWGRATS